jgi:hypothetical protein
MRKILAATEPTRPPPSTDSVFWIFAVMFLLFCIAGVIIASGR